MDSGTCNTTSATGGGVYAGVRVNYASAQVYLNGFRVLSSAGEGLRIDSATLFHGDNLDVNGANAQGFTTGNITGDFALSNLRVKNVNKTGGLNRAVDLESITGTVTVNNVNIQDNQTTPTGYQFFTYNLTGQGTISNVTGYVTNGNLAFNTSGTDNTKKRNFFGPGFTQPGCSAATRSLTWAIESASGTTDHQQVCTKNASDAYVWLQIF